MKSLLRRFRAWRSARRERYAERWAATRPYDGEADKYMRSGPGPDTFPPVGGGSP